LLCLPDASGGGGSVSSRWTPCVNTLLVTRRPEGDSFVASPVKLMPAELQQELTTSTTGTNPPYLVPISKSRLSQTGSETALEALNAYVLP
jgi:hypothetical protein